MHPLAEARRQLVEAAGLTAVLTAALGSFEAMRTEIHAQEDKAGPGFAAFALAGVSAAGGWHAIAAAPSLPPAVNWEDEPAPPAQPAALDEAEAAAELVALAQMLASRLDQATAQAANPGDRQACQDGARYAAAVSARLDRTAGS
jgi:hypothetical protein